MPAAAAERFLALLDASLRDATFAKLTLGKPAPAATDPTLKNVYVRPVALKSGPHLAFVYRHATRDLAKNFAPAAAFAEIARLLGPVFLDAHLFTATQTAQLETAPDGTARLRVSAATTAPSQPAAHDHAKSHVIPADAPWLRALGVTNDRGQPREGMAAKFRQIQKFAELLTHLLAEAFPKIGDAAPAAPPLHVLDAGSGKGYLTFAVAALLGERARVSGTEARADLVALCNRVAAENNLSHRLTFTAAQILPATEEIEKRKSEIETPVDVLLALHACDTATDDALARGIAAGAQLLVVSPCCHQELRPRLTAPPVLADALRHGIFLERHAEFVTDALRAQLLDWAGYRTKVFEFVTTEHTAKNLMLAAIKSHPPGDAARAQSLREFAAFYGLRAQRLARHLGFPL